MSNAEQIENLQDNPFKQEVRSEILKQVLAFNKVMKKPESINLVSLPATEWRFEKQLIEAAKGKFDVGIYAAEKSSFFAEVQANAPKEAKMVSARDIDEVIRNGVYLNSNFDNAWANVIWADYCGNPAEYNGNLTNSYSYPHLQTFVKKVEMAVANGDVLLYYMTFCCNGRIEGGKDSLISAMAGGNCSSLPSAIRAKISMLLAAKKLNKHVTEIFRIAYHGGKRSNMITLGFAINFLPNFEKVKKDRMDEPRHSNETTDSNDYGVYQSKTLSAEDILIANRKQAIRDLYDKGWKNENIASLLNLSRNQVGSVLAHHCHPESFKN